MIDIVHVKLYTLKTGCRIHFLIFFSTHSAKYFLIMGWVTSSGMN